jgi:uncharacterized protein YndB with AHSA1/START domain
VTTNAPFNPNLDLILDRIVPTPRRLVWKAWTEPEHLMKWFCPLPWKTVQCEIDLRPGGRFFTVMNGPNGEEMAGEGCYLVVEHERRLLWTTALRADYRPNPMPMGDAAFVFTGDLTFTDVPGGTRYHVHAMHATAEGRNTHDSMGFAEGWNKALDQLVEAMKE